MPEILEGLRREDICYDESAPFNVEHFGKFMPPTLTYTNMMIKYRFEEPRGHCITMHPASGALHVMRFTPLKTEGLPRYPDNTHRVGIGVFDSAEQAAEVHLKHMKYLAGIGILPWLGQVSPGTCKTLDDTEGVYTLQDILPTEAEPMDAYLTDTTNLNLLVDKYRGWSKNGPQLRDVADPRQYSVIAGEIYMHDIEPLYWDIGKYNAELGQ